MYDNEPKGISFSAAFFILIASAIVALMVANNINALVWKSMTGTSYEQFLSGTANPANARAYQVVQCLNAIIGFMVPTFIVAYLINRRPARLLGLTTPVSGKQIVLVFFIVAAALYVGGALSYFNNAIPLPHSWKTSFDKLESQYDQQVQAVLALKTPADYIIALLIMAFLPAMAEEVLFRGGIQNFLSRAMKKPWLAIIIASLIFSAAHFSWYGFFFRFALGVTLGCLYYYSQSLWAAILAHFLNNALIVTIAYVYVRQGKTVTDVLEQKTSTYWGLLTLPVLIILFMIYKRVSLSPRKQQYS
jgi:CAAX protease family protein